MKTGNASGHDVLLSNAISSGAFVYLLNWTIDLQFSRKAVATQSAPVSPAPMMITFFPLAVIVGSSISPFSN